MKHVGMCLGALLTVALIPGYAQLPLTPAQQS